MVALMGKGHEVTEGHGGATEEGPWCYKGRATVVLQRAMMLQREGHGATKGGAMVLQREGHGAPEGRPWCYKGRATVLQREGHSATKGGPWCYRCFFCAC